MESNCCVFRLFVCIQVEKLVTHRINLLFFCVCVFGLWGQNSVRVNSLFLLLSLLLLLLSLLPFPTRETEIIIKSKQKEAVKRDRWEHNVTTAQKIKKGKKKVRHIEECALEAVGRCKLTSIRGEIAVHFYINASQTDRQTDNTLLIPFGGPPAKLIHVYKRQHRSITQILCSICTIKGPVCQTWFDL